LKFKIGLVYAHASLFLKEYHFYNFIVGHKF
jgi:hypothetical protein